MRAPGPSRLLSGKRRGRLVMGVAGFAVSLAYVYQAIKTLPMGEMSEPGPAAYPVAVGAFTAIACLAIIAEELIARRDPVRDSLDVPRAQDLRRLLGTVLSTAGYVAVLSVFGFLPASIMLALVVVRLLKGGSWLWTVVAAIGIAGSTFVLFDVILDVPLPKGTLL